VENEKDNLVEEAASVIEMIEICLITFVSPEIG